MESLQTLSRFKSVNKITLISVILLALGALVILWNDLLNLISGYDVFEGLWNVTPDWVLYSTHFALGFLIAGRNKSLVVSVFLCFLATLTDIVLWVLCILPSLLDAKVLSATQFPYIVQTVTSNTLTFGLVGLLGVALFRLKLFGVAAKT